MLFRAFLVFSRSEKTPILEVKVIIAILKKDDIDGFQSFTRGERV